MERIDAARRAEHKPHCARADRAAGATTTTNRGPLVNLTLYPGRSEFSYFPENIPAVVVEPLGQRGWLLVAGWSVRCFSRSDELWITGLAEKLRTALEAHLDQETV